MNDLIDTTIYKNLNMLYYLFNTTYYNRFLELIHRVWKQQKTFGTSKELTLLAKYYISFLLLSLIKLELNNGNRVYKDVLNHYNYAKVRKCIQCDKIELDAIAKLMELPPIPIDIGIGSTLINYSNVIENILAETPLDDSCTFINTSIELGYIVEGIYIEELDCNNLTKRYDFCQLEVKSCCNILNNNPKPLPCGCH